MDSAWFFGPPLWGQKGPRASQGLPLGFGAPKMGSGVKHIKVRESKPMQNPLVNVPNGAICCKLWPQTILGWGPKFWGATLSHWATTLPQGQTLLPQGQAPLPQGQTPLPLGQPLCPGGNPSAPGATPLHWGQNHFWAGVRRNTPKTMYPSHTLGSGFSCGVRVRGNAPKMSNPNHAGPKVPQR